MSVSEAISVTFALAATLVAIVQTWRLSDARSGEKWECEWKDRAEKRSDEYFDKYIDQMRLKQIAEVRVVELEKWIGAMPKKDTA